MAEYEQHSRRQTDSRLRKFWHDWMPLIACVASLAGAFGGMVYGGTVWKTTVEHSLNDLKDGQKSQNERLGHIEAEHHVMVEKIDKVMFRLRIPIDDTYPPEYHAWPQQDRKGPDATLDRELDKLYKNDGHSFAQPTQPVVGSMQAPPPPQMSRKEW